MIKTFNAFLEDWEEDLVHQNNPTAMYKLLKKYGGMKYIWPGSREDTFKYASTITDDTLVFRTKPKIAKNDKDTDPSWGWCVILVPKGHDFDMDLLEEYEHEAIDGINLLHTHIAISDQDANVIVYDIDGDVVNPEQFHVDCMDESVPYAGKWSSYPNCNSTNPNN